MIKCEGLKPFLAKEYRNLPESRYISILLLRTTQSEAIFRTEGSGEGCSREIVADLEGKSVCRAVISKRKQVAVERREGRQVLRKFELLFSNTGVKPTDTTVCSMNRNHPCEMCIDCMLYGYAVGKGQKEEGGKKEGKEKVKTKKKGAQKSRVISDDAFSLLPFEIITDKKTFNGLYEDNTMRDIDGKSSTSLGEDQYIIPGAHFLDIEVLKDTTEAEFVYVMANILRSKRYGAITSRIGSVSNTILSVIGSDTEMFSTLEWVNMTASALQKDNIEHPQPDIKVVEHAKKSIDTLKTEICGQFYQTTDQELEEMTESIKTLYASADELQKALKALTNSYPGNEELVK